MKTFLWYFELDLNKRTTAKKSWEYHARIDGRKTSLVNRVHEKVDHPSNPDSEELRIHVLHPCTVCGNALVGE